MDRTDLPERIGSALTRLAGDLPALGLAVSGGGDSVALMHLAARWAGHRRVEVATIDHGLRPASAAEAEGMARAAGALGLRHDTLRWAGPTSGNLMDEARRARLRMLSVWARSRELPAVALGHTRDDVAETLVMRLSRGAGLDGLAAMAELRRDHEMVWLRPLLGAGREALRDWLRAEGIAWVDDPSNEDAAFERVRARQAIRALGLDPAALADSAAHLGRARDALAHAALPLVEGAEAVLGSLRLDRQTLAAAHPEQRRRVVIAAVRWVTGADYPPRRATVEHAMRALATGQRTTLDGAVLDPQGRVVVHREAAAVCGVEGDIWDRRWRLRGLRPGDRLRALGADAKKFDWRAAGLTHLESQALPVVERGEMLLCPALEPTPDLTATPLRDVTVFRRILVGH